MSSIEQNIKELKQQLGPSVKLVAVSKFQPNEKIMEAYNAGQRLFGENRPQEFEQKVKSLPEDIQWHFVGHLQTNKIKMVAPYAALIHSVDSEKLLFELEKFGAQNNLNIKCLLEIFIAKEESKQGFTFSEAEELLERLRTSPLKNVTLCGVMGMATLTKDKEQISKEFTQLYSFFSRIKQRHLHLSEFKEVSMGMSEDFPIACRLGASIVRIGTKIFGEREYKE